MLQRRDNKRLCLTLCFLWPAFLSTCLAWHVLVDSSFYFFLNNVFTLPRMSWYFFVFLYAVFKVHCPINPKRRWKLAFLTRVSIDWFTCLHTTGQLCHKVSCQHFWLIFISHMKSEASFKSHITGKVTPAFLPDVYHISNSTSLLIGLAVISCCSSLPVSMPKDFVWSFHTLVGWYFRFLGEVLSNLDIWSFIPKPVFFLF